MKWFDDNIYEKLVAKSEEKFVNMTKEELKQTSVYRFKIESWSGKKNWEEKAEQAENNEWPDLDPKWFDFY